MSYVSVLQHFVVGGNRVSNEAGCDRLGQFCHGMGARLCDFGGSMLMCLCLLLPKVLCLKNIACDIYQNNKKLPLSVLSPAAQQVPQSDMKSPPGLGR